MSYITAADIKSNLAQGFNLTDYLAEADAEVNDIAQKLGIRDTEDIAVPVHYKIKRYAVVFVLMRLAQDKIGTNQPDTAIEKYKDLYAMYRQELKDLYPQITYEMITGDVETITGRTVVYNVYRT